MQVNDSTLQLSTWNGLDGLINNKPFMPGASPAQRARVLMELAELEGELLGNEERQMVLAYAEAVEDDRQVSNLINELCENADEARSGSMSPTMRDYIVREIASAYAARAENPFALAPAM